MMRLLTSEEREVIISGLSHRFGFNEQCFERYHFARVNKKKLQLIPCSSVFPKGIPIETPGMDFLNMRGHVPKLSTSAAKLLGRKACRNTLILGDCELLTYIQRRDLLITDERAKGIKSRGYVIIRHKRDVPGLGFAHACDDGWRIESKFPKGRFLS